jgi:hypothetical protein
VDPHGMSCGGFTINPHHCPAQYKCVGDRLPVDVPGTCVQTCGGFAGFQCDAGYSCVDDVTDSCDPNHGGADCPGVCEKAPADCRSSGCGTGQYCSFCWGSYACIPNGAVC